MRSELASTLRSRATTTLQRGWLLAFVLAGCAQLLSLDESRVHGSCTTDSQCAPGHSCLLGACRDGCTSDAECGSGARCLKAIGSSACIPYATDCGEGCPEGTQCEHKTCRTSCETVNDCAGGQECQGRLCVGNEEAPITTGGSGGAGGAQPVSHGGEMTGAGGLEANGGEGGAGGQSDSCLTGCVEQQCEPSERFCSDNAVRECAEDGLSSTVLQACGSGYYCDTTSVACKLGVCAPNEPSCDGNRATLCRADGSGFESGGTACTALESCEAGTCQPHVCAPGTTYCDGQQVKVCSVNGLSSSLSQTCANQTCVEASGSASCQGICAPAQKRCSGRQRQVCADGGNYADSGTICSTNGSCDPGSVTCKCNEGYTGNGTTCTNINECTSGDHDCGANATCTDTPGSFTCACKPGYSGNGVTCARTSCVGLSASCGATASDDCCASPTVDGGTFSFEVTSPAITATVTSFALDKFEVTVGRFRNFVESFTGAPAAGAGSHPLIANSGWQAGWSSSLAADKAALATAVQCNSLFKTWNASGANDFLPMNCVSWYEAFAFCAWDGGRLATLAEYQYAASGGSENRTYPSGPTLSFSHAVYDCNGNGTNLDCVFADMPRVGSKPLGIGRYGQLDLIGSMQEWLFDGTGTYPDPCVNCAHVGGVGRASREGHWRSLSEEMSNDASNISTGVDPTTRSYMAGFRCARTVP